MSQLTINERFCGPPDSANGGYTCGVMSADIDDPLSIRLFKPIPLATPLELSRISTSVTLMTAEGELVAEGKPASPDWGPPHAPPAPDVESARTASRGFVALDNHPYPTCFVCGPGRAKGDGLRLFAGPVADEKAVATVWRPTSDFATSDGSVAKEYVFAALDCPGAWSVLVHPKPILLAQFTGLIHAPLQCDRDYVAMGWAIEEDGRKHHVGTALFTEDGQCCATARALWIEPRSCP